VTTFPEDPTLEDVSLPDVVEGFTKQRVELVQRAVREWTRALVDLGGRNNLLRYRDLRQGTLDLTNARPKALEGLLQSKATKVSALFSDPEEREGALRRVRTIHNKAKENFEERGLETLSLGCGLATWDNKRAAWEPAAPVLLRQATLRPLGAAQDEFELALVDEMEVNPTLLHLLKVDFDCAFDHEKLLDRVDGVIDELWELDKTFEWMTEQTRRVPSFAIQPRLVLANFAYAKLPMVRDLETAFDELVAHDLVAAIAGDEDARESVRAAGPGPDAVPSPDQVPLSDEFLVLDADSSQNYAINAVLGGESLIVRGPPGTGKSQTIANLIASLLARNKRVLFVAEKRAAIDAVLKRLRQQKLGDLLLDLHGGVSSRRAFSQSVGAALNASRAAPKVDHAPLHRKVEKRRDELNDHVAALHEIREPWGLSVYELRSELQGVGPDRQTNARFRGRDLERLDDAARRQAEEDLGEYARLGGLTLGTSGSPWARANVVSGDEAQEAFELVDGLRRHTLPTTLEGLDSAATEARVAPPRTLEGWAKLLDLWKGIREMLEFFEQGVYEQDLDRVLEALRPAESGAFKRLAASVGSADYRAARRGAREWVLGGKASAGELCRRLRKALDERRQWQQSGGVGLPTATPNLDALVEAHAELLAQVERLGKLVERTDIETLDVDQLRGEVDHLAQDRGNLVTLPELHRLATALQAGGLGELLAELAGRGASEETAVGTFRFAWLQSILDQLAMSDRLVEGFRPDKHEKVVDDFIRGDREHIHSAADRIRRACAEAATRARDEFKDQAQIVQHQANLKRRHMPVRDLVHSTSDVLLALKPCWATSPLVVSQLLPPKTYFDVVIFDEASQITPADAIPSILRGAQLVVAGDEKQLPPTAFFVSETPEDEDDEADELSTPVPLTAGTKGFESILDALGSLLRFRMLRWHYRSRDERLIAFSNAHLYDHQLITFPGPGGEDVLRHVVVGHDPAAETNSPTPEVDTAVDLIIEHARQRPHESLGVIAMGIKHSNRIEECLRQRLHEEPNLEEELGPFFAEDVEERFFVKNLERVQGDERDAIILSVGYGKNARGDPPYRFGPLLTEGGERRLNVAVTRAKNRMTLVSSFGVREMDPERSPAEGVKLLRQYLQYVESGGENLGDVVREKPALNPFEVDVRDTLSRHGLKLSAQYGSSGYWIDYAVQHPTQPGRYVLALECDGATYHSSESARDRDRLRQEQLERIGWRFHRVWSSEWFYDKERCVEKVLQAYEDAVAAADEQDKTPQPPVRRAADRAVEEPVAENVVPSATPWRSGRRPDVPAGYVIDYYTQPELVRLVRWIESDEVLRTEDELLNDVMQALGFKRRGQKIVGRIKRAIIEARANAAGGGR
jgi:very-short-patch-repair endonuclease